MEWKKGREGKGQLAALLSLQEAEKCGLVFKKQSVICSTFLCVRFFLKKRDVSLLVLRVCFEKDPKKNILREGSSALLSGTSKILEPKKKPYPEIQRTPTFFTLHEDLTLDNMIPATSVSPFTL